MQPVDRLQGSLDRADFYVLRWNTRAWMTDNRVRVRSIDRLGDNFLEKSVRTFNEKIKVNGSRLQFACIWVERFRVFSTFRGMFYRKGKGLAVSFENRILSLLQNSSLVNISVESWWHAIGKRRGLQSNPKEIVKACWKPNRIVASWLFIQVKETRFINSLLQESAMHGSVEVVLPFSPSLFTRSDRTCISNKRPQ